MAHKPAFSFHGSVYWAVLRIHSNPIANAGRSTHRNMAKSKPAYQCRLSLGQQPHYHGANVLLCVQAWGLAQRR